MPGQFLTPGQTEAARAHPGWPRAVRAMRTAGASGSDAHARTSQRMLTDIAFELGTNLGALKGHPDMREAWTAGGNSRA